MIIEAPREQSIDFLNFDIIQSNIEEKKITTKLFISKHQNIKKFMQRNNLKSL